jgi:hypothetical protein
MVMAYAKELFELVSDMEALLVLFRATHNGMYSSPWWRSLPIPGLFKPIPFGTYQKWLVDIEQKLADKDGRLRNLRQNPHIEPNEKAYYIEIHRFAQALQNAAVLLRTIVTGLNAKTENKPYEKATYKAHLAAYQTSLRTLVEAATRMRRLRSTLADVIL